MYQIRLDYGAKIAITAPVMIGKVCIGEIEGYALAEPDSRDLMDVAIDVAPDSDEIVVVSPLDHDPDKAFTARHLLAHARSPEVLSALEEAWEEENRMRPLCARADAYWNDRKEAAE